MTTLIESDVEEAALGWLRGLGWQTAYGPDIGPDSPRAERDNYGQAVLERWLQDALALLHLRLGMTLEVQVVNSHALETNNRLVADQFTVTENRNMRCPDMCCSLMACPCALSN